MNRSRLTGFTIVELLIVIVVIAILAAITMVAFNGVQLSAKNTKHYNDAKQAEKLLRSYRSVNGSYPVATSCVGRNFQDWDSDGIGECWDSTCSVIVEARDDFNTQIETVGRMNGGTNQGFERQAGCGTQYMVGPVYDSATQSIRYWQKRACPEGSAVWSENGLNQCMISIST